MSNETISKWLGECRHKDGWGKGWLKLDTPEFVATTYECQDCKLQAYVDMSTHLPQAPDYENDESAWTQEIYGRIEEAGLWVSFKHELWQIFITHEWTKHQRKVTTGDMLRATPAQKAAALSRAIEEASDG